MKAVRTSWIGAAAWLFLLPVAATAQQPTYSVSGAANVGSATGLHNPYTLLRRPDVQAIATEALRGPIAAERLEALLRGSEVTVDHLLETSVIERSGDGRYKLAMTVLTAADRALINQVTDPLGRNLAEAFLAERSAFDRILARYDMPGVDPEMVRMALIGCVIMDWDGLGVTASGGYRTAPVRTPYGGRYQMVLRERVPTISERGLYWGSHGAQVAGDTIWLTTFGDHHSGSQRMAFPDLTWIIDGADMEAHAPRTVAPQLAEAFSAKMSEMQEVAGPIMIALRAGPADSAALAAAVRQPPERTQPVLDLLAALQYVQLQDGRYRAAIPVFTAARDGEMIREYRDLGKAIIRRWLEANYDRTRSELSGLAALRAGVPFRTMFTELWHPIFGWANYHLVKLGYLHDPYGPSARFVSFVPFVWDAPLMMEEGTKIFD